jgi:hypothetical protein
MRLDYSVCEKWLHEIAQFSPKLALIADVTNALNVLENVRNIGRSKMEMEIVIWNTNYFIEMKFYLIQLHCFVLDYIWGIIHHTCAKDAFLHTFVTFITVTKRC